MVLNNLYSNGVYQISFIKFSANKSLREGIS